MCDDVPPQFPGPAPHFGAHRARERPLHAVFGLGLPGLRLLLCLYLLLGTVLVAALRFFRLRFDLSHIHVLLMIIRLRLAVDHSQYNVGFFWDQLK